MSHGVVVYKGRTNRITVSIPGVDLSNDVITSEIRTEAGLLIVAWDVSFDSDGTDGELILTLDDTDTASIPYATGVMDLKRVTGGEQVAVFDDVLEVE